MARITVVGERLARPGSRFLNREACELAGACPIAKPCQSLPWDREFRVVAARPVHHDVCKVHEGGVRVVEVEMEPVRASLEATKTRGTAAKWAPPVCHIRACPNWSRCFPHGATPGQEYGLKEIGARMSCPMGYQLVAVTLSDAPAR